MRSLVWRVCLQCLQWERPRRKPLRVFRVGNSPRRKKMTDPREPKMRPRMMRERRVRGMGGGFCG